MICDYLRYSYAHDPDSDDLFSFAVVAPTGLAAYNVNGMTMHRFFKLPVQHGSGINNWNLRHEDLKQLRHKTKNLRLIIIGKFIFHYKYFLIINIF